MMERSQSVSATKVILLVENNLASLPESLKQALNERGFAACYLRDIQHLNLFFSLLVPKTIFVPMTETAVDDLQSAFGDLGLSAVCESVDELFSELVEKRECVVFCDSGKSRYSVFNFTDSTHWLGDSHTIFSLSEANLSLAVGSKSIKFTRAEFSILKCLIDNHGEIATKEHLVEVALGRPAHPQDRSVDVHVCRIRKKLAEVFSGNTIASVRGGGYAFCVEKSTFYALQ